MTHKKRLTQCMFALLLLFGCRQGGEQTIYTPIFSLKPGDNQCRVDTINSYCGRIICGNDSIYYDLSFMASSLSDNVREVIYFPSMTNVETGDTDVMHNIIDTESIIVVRRRDYDVDAYRKQNLQFRKEGGCVIKYTFPIDTINGGNVGVYYDGVKVDGDHRLKFAAFLENPHSGNYSKARDLIGRIYLYPIDSTHLPLPWGTLYVP